MLLLFDSNSKSAGGEETSMRDPRSTVKLLPIGDPTTRSSFTKTDNQDGEDAPAVAE